jgi:GABA permease
MAVARPTTGSFVEYARAALGDWAGFVAGWLYWYFWVIVLAVEAIAGATIIQGWIPGLPLWLVSLCLMIALTATNLGSVRSYGEFEFWFASIKVGAIVVFIAIAAGWLLGIGGSGSPGLSHLTDHGGFFAAGGTQVLAGVVIVIFAFVGAEIVTIAAAETDQPERAVAKATNQVVARVLVFYVLAVFLVVCIVPWNDTKLGDSPFIASLERIGIPGAADVMNAIVVTAVLSCLNSGIYTASRMVHALARKGDAPAALGRTNARGVPVAAILLSVTIGFVSVIFDKLSPDKVFLFLVNSSGAVALFCYIMIAAAEIRMRRRLEREEPEALALKMWLFPWLSYAAIVAMVGVVVSMAFVDTVRSQLLPSFLALGLVLLLAWRRGLLSARSAGARDLPMRPRPGRTRPTTGA